jgi:predicted nucleotidyltransferase
VLEAELTRWLDLLRRRYRPQRIILFGSLASGPLAEWSDVDLVVIKETPLSFLQRSAEVLRLLHPRAGVDVLV